MMILILLFALSADYTWNITYSKDLFPDLYRLISPQRRRERKGDI